MVRKVSWFNKDRHFVFGQGTRRYKLSCEDCLGNVVRRAILVSEKLNYFYFFINNSNKKLI